MRRLLALALLGFLGACSSMDDIAPTTARSGGSVSGTVAVAYPRFSDSDPHEWVARSPRDYAVHGTDVSKYQGAIDWHTAKASGISFAFIKATEGGDRVDDYFD